jgi:translation elongation factor EF-G
MRVADSAAVVVSGVTGVEVTTEKVWKFADQYELPRVVIINKMDRERASYSRTLDALQKKFGKNVVPIQLPIGEEKDFTGVIDLVSMKAYKYPTDGSGKLETIDIPAGASAYTIEDSIVLPVDVDVQAVQPHAHYLAHNVRGAPAESHRRPQARGLASRDLPGGPRLGIAQHRRPRHPRRLRAAAAVAG